MTTPTERFKDWPNSRHWAAIGHPDYLFMNHLMREISKETERLTYDEYVGSAVNPDSLRVQASMFNSAIIRSSSHRDDQRANAWMHGFMFGVRFQQAKKETPNDHDD